MKKLKQFFVVCIVCMMSVVASAEVLLIERTQKNHNEAVPKHGQSMQQVESQFGQPLARHEAVGEPPISRWEYASYVVYFEHQLVINTVFKRSKNNPTETP